MRSRGNGQNGPRGKPEEVFQTAEFVEWDEHGVPVKDGNVEIPKSRRKKLTKDWERQKKMHEQWLVLGS
jgi:cysteinyl-tRNA synthetase